MPDRNLGININIEGNSTLFREALKSAGLGLKELTKDLGGVDRAMTGFTANIRSARDATKDYKTSINEAARANESLTLWTKRVRDALKDEERASIQAAAALDKKRDATKDATSAQGKLADVIRAAMNPALEAEKRKALEAAGALEVKERATKKDKTATVELAGAIGAANKKMVEQAGASELAKGRLEAQTRSTNELARAQNRQSREQIVNVRNAARAEEEALRKREEAFRKFGAGLIPGGRRATGAAGFAGGVAGAAMFGAPLSGAGADVLALGPAAVAGIAPLAGLLPAIGAGAVGAAEGMAVFKLALDGVGKVIAADTPTKLRTAMRNLDPTAQAIAMRFRKDLTPALASLREVAQKTVIPSLLTLGDTMAKLAKDGAIHDGFAAAGKGIATTLEAVNKLFSNSAFQGRLDEMLTGVGKGIGNLAQILPPMIDGFVRMTNLAMPLANSLAQMFGGWMKDADKWVSTHGPQISAFFRDTLMVVERWGHSLHIAFSLMSGLASAAKGLSMGIWDSLDRTFGHLSDIVNSKSGQKSLKQFFDEALPTLRSFGSLFGALVTEMGHLAAMKDTQSMLRGLFDGLKEYVLPFLKTIAETIPKIAVSLGPTLKVLGDFALESLKPMVDALLQLVQVALPPLASLVRTIADMLRIPLQQLTSLVQLLSQTIGLLAGLGGVKGGGALGGIAELGIGLLAFKNFGKITSEAGKYFSGGLWHGGAEKAAGAAVGGSSGTAGIAGFSKREVENLSALALGDMKGVGSVNKLQAWMRSRVNQTPTFNAVSRRFAPPEAGFVNDVKFAGKSPIQFDNNWGGITRDTTNANLYRSFVAGQGVEAGGKFAAIAKAAPMIAKRFAQFEVAMTVIDALEAGIHAKGGIGNFAKAFGGRAFADLTDPLTHGSLGSGVLYGASIGGSIAGPVGAGVGSIAAYLGHADPAGLSGIPKDLSSNLKGLKGGDIAGITGFLKQLKTASYEADVSTKRSFASIRKSILDSVGPQVIAAAKGLAPALIKSIVDPFKSAENSTGSIMDAMAQAIGGVLDHISKDLGLKTKAGTHAATLAFAQMGQSIQTTLHDNKVSVDKAVGGMVAVIKNLGPATKLGGLAFSTFASGIDTAMRRGTTSVARGTEEMLKLLGQTLEALGVPKKSVKAINTISASVQATADSAAVLANPVSPLGLAHGGFIGSPGEAGGDNIPIVVGRGEAVLNRHQQAVVEPALQAVYGGGLGDLFNSVQTPHYMAKGGYVFPMASFGSMGRLDRGQDMEAAQGHERTLALGDGRIVSKTSWADVLQLTSGRYAGKRVFYGHNAEPSSPVGAVLKAGDTVGHTGNPIGGGGPTHAEIGFTDGGFDSGVSGGWGNRAPAIGAVWMHNLLHEIAPNWITGVATAGQAGQSVGGSGSGALPPSAVPHKIKQILSKLPGGIGAMSDGVLRHIHAAIQHKANSAAGSGGGSATPSAGGMYGKSALEALWVRAGGPRQLAPLMADIALAESGGDPNVNYNHGPGDGGVHVAAGLWQILGHPAGNFGSVYDPLENAKMAVAKWRQQGLGAWKGDAAYNREAGPFSKAPGKFARGGFVGGLPAFKGGGPVAHAARTTPGRHRPHRSPRSPHLHGGRRQHALPNLPGNAPAKFSDTSGTLLASITDKLEPDYSYLQDGTLAAIRDIDLDGNTLTGGSYIEGLQDVLGYDGASYAHLVENPAGIIGAWKDTQLIRGRVPILDAERKVLGAVSGDMGSLNKVVGRARQDMIARIYGPYGTALGGKWKQGETHGYGKYTLTRGGNAGGFYYGYLNDAERAKKVIAYLQRYRSSLAYQEKRKKITDKYAKLRADMAKDSIRKNYTRSRLVSSASAALRDEELAEKHAVDDSFMDPVTAGDAKYAITVAFNHRRDALAAAETATRSKNAKAKANDAISAVDARSLLSAAERNELFAVTREQDGAYGSRQLRLETQRGILSDANDGIKATVKRVRADASVISSGDPDALRKDKLLLSALYGMGVGFNFDEPSSAMGVLKDRLSALPNQIRTEMGVTIPSLVRDREDILGRYKGGSSSVDQSALNSLLQAQNEALLKSSALKDLQFGVFQGFAPLLAARMQGSFAKGGIIPETGMALVHKNERITPDPDGPFKRYGEDSSGVSGDTNVELHLHGGLGDMVEKAVMRHAGKISTMTSERLGRRQRLIASAPGGR